MIKGLSTDINNIMVIIGNEKTPLNISVSNGLWIGFEIEKDIKDLADYSFDLSDLRIEKPKFTSNAKIEKLVEGLVCAELDLHDLGEFEIEGKLYYQIKDLEDGNYLAIDGKGKVYTLHHDPFEITLINDSIKTFVEAVNTGEVNLTDF